VIRRVALLVTAGLLLAACSTQTPSPSATTSPSATVAPSPTPSLAASPSPLIPTAQPSPSGGVAYVGDTFAMFLPNPWTMNAPDPSQPNRVDFVGLGVAQLSELTTRADAGLTLAHLTTTVIASVKKQTGASPERQEAIKIGGLDATMLTTHYTVKGNSVYHLEALCIRHGLIYDFFFANYSGAEAQDRAFFLAAIATVVFIGP